MATMGEQSDEKVTVASLYHTCDACPSQWQGRTSNGGHIYVRYRWGRLTIGVGETFDDALSGPCLIAIQHGDALDGYMQYDELRLLTRDKIDWPARAMVVEGDPPDSTE